MAADDKFPVLIFNHGLYLVAEQNTILMEHLASHGYVIFSIAHPYPVLRSMLVRQALLSQVQRYLRLRRLMFNIK
ncbi:MAG: hypothetical protein HRU25_02420 [Psychrobium sp.]|nr:hypothetical protein [Psychrobium sp.]